MECASRRVERTLTVLNPNRTMEADGKQTRVILTTTMRVEKHSEYRLDPDGYCSLIEDEPEVEESDGSSEYSGRGASR
jgi:hypothetical protein